MSSHTAEIRKFSEPILKKIYAYSIKSEKSRILGKKLVFQQNLKNQIILEVQSRDNSDLNGTTQFFIL